jgi:hypothetical protein
MLAVRRQNGSVVQPRMSHCVVTLLDAWQTGAWGNPHMRRRARSVVCVCAYPNSRVITIIKASLHLCFCRFLDAHGQRVQKGRVHVKVMSFDVVGNATAVRLQTRDHDSANHLNNSRGPGSYCCKGSGDVRARTWKGEVRKEE